MNETAHRVRIWNYIHDTRKVCQQQWQAHHCIFMITSSSQPVQALIQSYKLNNEAQRNGTEDALLQYVKVGQHLVYGACMNMIFGIIRSHWTGILHQVRSNSFSKPIGHACPKVCYWENCQYQHRSSVGSHFNSKSGQTAHYWTNLPDKPQTMHSCCPLRIHNVAPTIDYSPNYAFFYTAPNYSVYTYLSTGSTVQYPHAQTSPHMMIINQGNRGKDIWQTSNGDQS